MVHISDDTPWMPRWGTKQYTKARQDKATKTLQPTVSGWYDIILYSTTLDCVISFYIPLPIMSLLVTPHITRAPYGI